MINTVAMQSNVDVTWPVKTHEMHNHHTDSTRWNDFRFRDDDIVIATYGKSGYHWMCQIASQLISDGDPNAQIPEVAWVDFRIRDKDVMLSTLEAQTTRRVLKTHLQRDALVFSPLAKYIVVGRDGRDLMWSMYDFHSSFSDKHYSTLNNGPGRVGPPLGPPPADIRQYFLDWLDKDGYPFWPFFSYMRSWWEVRHLPNVLFVHFVDLKRDLSGQMRRVAQFLDVSVDESRWPEIVEHCTFDWMKANWDTISPPRGLLKSDGPGMVNKGTNQRWKDVLSAEDVAKYETRVYEELTPECAHWLITGELKDV